MQEYLTRDQVRRVDQAAIQELGIPGLLLMENAARGVCDVIRRLGEWRRLLIIAGHGNNGGDGLAVARLLAAEGISAEIFLVTAGRSLSADAQANFDFLIRCGITVQQPLQSAWPEILSGLGRSDLIVDALLGTGIRGTVSSPIAEVIEQINGANATVLAVDLPSGMDCDTGRACGVCVRADWTVTFVAKKCAFQFAETQSLTGSVVVRHIGLPEVWLQRWFVSCAEDVSRQSERGGG